MSLWGMRRAGDVGTKTGRLMGCGCGWRHKPSPVAGCCISPCFAAAVAFGVLASPLVTISLRFGPRDEPSYSFPLCEGKQAGPCLLSLPSKA